MRLNLVALTSRYCNDKGFYRIRSSPLIIALQFCIRLGKYSKSKNKIFHMGHKKARCSYHITICNEANQIVFQNTNIKVRQECWFFWSPDQQVVIKA